MTVLLVSGSPRKGNTDYLLERIASDLSSESEILYLRDYSIGHCMGDLYCLEKDGCIIRDDMDGIRAKMRDASVIVLASPNYFENVSGLMKNFMDRCHPLMNSEGLSRKKMILIMVGGGSEDGTLKDLDDSFRGFVKYMKVEVFGKFAFSGLSKTDVKKDAKVDEKIREIAKWIESVSTY